MDEDFHSLRFIGETIEVEFDRTPTLTKKPDAPSSFQWNGATFQIDAVLSSWFDYERRGKMGKNMRPSHLKSAARMGSWGVGRFYFRVRESGGRIFDLYYDRAPKDAADREGRWILFREMASG